MAFTIHKAPERKLQGVAFGVAGLRNGGRGILGGYPGSPSVMVLYKDTRIQELLAKNRVPRQVEELEGDPNLLPYCTFELREQDVLYYLLRQGGGVGDPLDRDLALMVRDLENGFVSPEVAESVYGVALSDRESMTIDAKATEALRALHRKQRLNGRIGSAASEAGSRNGKAARPLRENLDICDDARGSWVQCSRCGHVFCQVGEDWRAACHVARVSPATVGPQNGYLLGRYLFEERYCPGCGTLLDVGVVEANVNAG